MRHTLVKALLSITLFMLCACSTKEQQAKGMQWIDLFTSGIETGASPADLTYGIDRVEKDTKTLQTLQNEMADLTNEITGLKRELLTKEEPYLNDSENKQIELFIYRAINARDALAELVNYYREHLGDNEDTHTKGAIVGMSAALTRNYFGSYFCALFHDNKDLTKILNIAHPRYDLPKNCYDRLFDHVTSIDNLELLDLSWFLFCKDLNQSDSALYKIKQSDSKYTALISAMDTLHADTHIQTRYLLYSDRHTLKDLENRLRHSEIAKLGALADQKLQNDLYTTRGFIFKNVARIQRPDSHLLTFTDAQVKQIHDALQPGDIILTYTAGYMSNIFLPGNFKHGITYIGSPAQRRTAGLSNEALTHAAVSPQQAKRLIQHVKAQTTPAGETIDIVEAVAEGVVLHSLDKLLKTHINRMVVIRPVITQQERLQQLITTFQYVGATYDFKFDFQDDTYQCCTELVYRSTNGMGSIDFSLVRMKGRWILAADDILRYYLGQNPAAFEFILLADKAPDSNNFNAEITQGDLGREALYQLMKVEKPSK